MLKYWLNVTINKVTSNLIKIFWGDFLYSAKPVYNLGLKKLVVIQKLILKNYYQY